MLPVKKQSDGVAIALIGQLRPIATILVAIFFAALRTGSATMQAAAGVPASVSDIRSAQRYRRQEERRARKRQTLSS